MDARTQTILNLFHESWTETLLRYDDLITNYSGFERFKPLREFILKLQVQDEDKYFRIGTSVHYLIISRSVNHGLRTDQKYIKIDVINEHDYYVTFREDTVTYREYRLQTLDDPRMYKLLKTLKDTLVD
ncbi:hypothetical protein G7092_09020 [Mucilaginibacter sp. HC2]|uniref:hypothetical protein n=1 Tax=Mucilaginibacter inviolabilis TaxID=2714892 RepID=UPI00140E56F9|nr:hypothetical protein [Mucilaginibacter inviolabilis]NHA03935.1 hypothetical protein [Mucilaginibacter inviolabilis]